MKKINLLIFVLALVVVPGCAPTSIPSHPDKLSNPLPNYNPTNPQRFELENGLVVYYQFDDELPVMKGQLYLPGGSVFEPLDRAGLAGVVGSMIREGGIARLSPNALDSRLDELGASIESNYADDHGTVAFSCLSGDFAEVFQTFSEAVRAPAFDKGRLKLIKDLSIEALRKRRDDPLTMARMIFGKVVYGPNTPYFNEATVKSLSSIGRADLLKFHQRFVRPNGAILMLTGSVPESEVRALITKQFGSWRADPKPLPALPTISSKYKPGVYVLERDFDQTSVIIGHRGPKRSVERSYAITLYNQIYSSGGFESVLFREVRSKRGLAYAVGGGISTGQEVGTIAILAGTRNDRALDTVSEIWKILSESRQVAPSEEYLDQAKSSIERGYVFKFASPSERIGRAGMIELIGYPPDYDATFLQKVRNITAEDVRKLAVVELRPEENVTVLVGKLSPRDVKRRLSDTPVYSVAFDEIPVIGAAVR